ncbi:MAG: dipeptide/oligopeptide/nickel ABC transporter ATP-binding protein [Propionibacteriaceae bacterium]|nr:dipeptide/oligopeptide/nickel ABC transporter ATP-binding protein [Propionibacteriaceae bacterium]
MTAFEMTHVSMTYGGRRRRVRALDDVSLSVEEHQKWGIVGQSGSGKTTLLKILAGLASPTSGQVRLFGRDLDLKSADVMAELRSSVQMVFQDPRSSLNPRMKISSIVSEPLRSPLVRNRPDMPTDHAARVAEVLRAVGLPPDCGDLYPHELSGGQRQRIALARALAPHPRILLADEPVSAMDVDVRAQVLNLLNSLVDSMGLTLIMVTHDLSVVRHTCDHVLVLNQGRVVEWGPTSTVMGDPREEYTRQLLASTIRRRTV